MHSGDNSHATEDDLERYSMGGMAEPALAKFEEHLLLCDHCQQRLSREDDFRHGMRQAAAAFPLQERRSPIRRTVPRFAWILSAAAVGLAVIIAIQWPMRTRSMGTAVVLLQSARGSEIAATVQSRRPVILVVDCTELQPVPQFRVEIVDNIGRSVYQADAAPHNNKLQATLPRGLAAGGYFLRLYSPARDLLREYSLTVQR